MIRVLTVLMALYLGGWLGAATVPALSAQTLTDLHAVRGDVFNARLDGVPVHFELAGVWVPTPPGTSDAAEYRGQEALEMVTEFLKSEKVVVQPAGKKNSQGRVPVRIRIGAEDPRDLAVLLADAGFALWTPEAVGSKELSQEVAATDRNLRTRYTGSSTHALIPIEREPYG